MKKILQSGVLVFISEGEEYEEILNLVKETTKLEKTINHLNKLTSCEVYVVR